jgi:GH24 family phage-related lysozyme (muramidase)
MHKSVLDAWPAFSHPLEGYVHSMYLDVKGLVTTGVGNLVDPVSEALRLPWKHADGRLAGKDEVGAAWHSLKSQQKFAKLHWKYAAKLNDLRLTDEDIDALVVQRLAANERYLKKAFPKWDEWPADAQLCCLSMAWAVGAGFPGIFKNFTKFANLDDWVSAKACAKIKTIGNPGVVPRNRNNELCLDNAATVHDLGLDPSILHWPNPAPLERVALAGRTEPPSPSIDAADRARVAAMQAEYARQLTERIHADAMAELAGISSGHPPPNDEGGDA